MNVDGIRSRLAVVAQGSRRLIVAAVLLVAVGVAVPVFLSRPGQSADLAALPATAAVTAPEPVSDSADTGPQEHTSPSRLSGPAHDPFVSTPTTTRSTKTTTSSRTPASTARSAPGRATTPTGTSTATQAGTAAGAASPPVTTATVTTPARTVTVIKTVLKPPRFSDHEAEVSLRQAGSGAQPLVFNRVARYQLLPSDASAIALFLGVRTGTTTAVFLLTDKVGVSGHGRCVPTVARCVLFTLRSGQSAKLTAPARAGDKTFTLTYHDTGVLGASASVVTADRSGRAVFNKAAGKYENLSSATFGRYTNLLSIRLGTTVPVGS